MDTEKLYSPLFCELVDKDNEEYYDGDYWKDPMSQEEAVAYEDEIHIALLKERFTDEEPRGLMEYYHEGNSVDDKVFSLFIDVEERLGKLWGVATIKTSEPLTPEEYDLLKDYISGQYSDGFGEGFEQREIKIDRGDLYVSLWSSGKEFFIDTEREFAQRFGLEPLARTAADKPSVIAQIRDAAKEAKSNPTADKDTPTPKKSGPEL